MLIINTKKGRKRAYLNSYANKNHINKVKVARKIKFVWAENPSQLPETSRKAAPKRRNTKPNVFDAAKMEALIGSGLFVWINPFNGTIKNPPDIPIKNPKMDTAVKLWGQITIP
jgi:hypothetical protein